MVFPNKRLTFRPLDMVSSARQSRALSCESPHKRPPWYTARDPHSPPLNRVAPCLCTSSCDVAFSYGLYCTPIRMHSVLNYFCLPCQIRLDITTLIGLLAYFVNYRFEDALSSP